MTSWFTFQQLFFTEGRGRVEALSASYGVRDCLPFSEYQFNSLYLIASEPIISNCLENASMLVVFTVYVMSL